LCSECTVKLENYELIFNELNQELNVDLNENFLDKLISRIRDEHLEAKTVREVDPLLLLFVLVGISFTAAIIYYIDFSALYGILSKLGSTEAFQLKLQNLVQSFGSINKFFVFGGIGAGILLALDKIIGRFFAGLKG